jgi:hypothetical protein
LIGTELIIHLEQKTGMIENVREKRRNSRPEQKATKVYLGTY